MWHVPPDNRSFRVRNSDLLWAAALTAVGVYFFGGYFTLVRFDRERNEVQTDWHWLSRAAAGREEVS